MSNQKIRDYHNNRRRLIKLGQWISSRPAGRLGSNIVCDNCKKEFYRSPANRGPGNQYCSEKCMSEAFMGKRLGKDHPRWKGTETRPCGGCGKEISRPHWRAKDRTNFFCDQKCFAIWKAENYTGKDNPCWRGGHPPYYGPNWQRQSREARKRDNHQCQSCKVHEDNLRRALDVHHILPIRYFEEENYKDANKLSNLISLCEVCHTTAEHICKYGTVSTWSELKPLLLSRIAQMQSHNLANS